MANKLETLIKTAAENPISKKFNLAQYQEGGTRHEEKKKALLHKNVCQQIMDFADKHKDIPLYFILSVGVSKGACKISEFEKGYKSFNAEEVFSVFKMGNEYNKYNGLEKRKMSDVTIRLIMRYYEKKSKEMDDFLTDLNNSKVLGKLCGSREMKYTDLCKNLNIPYKEKEETTPLPIAA